MYLEGCLGITCQRSLNRPCLKNLLFTQMHRYPQWGGHNTGLILWQVTCLSDKAVVWSLHGVYSFERYLEWSLCVEISICLELGTTDISDYSPKLFIMMVILCCIPIGAFRHFEVYVICQFSWCSVTKDMNPHTIGGWPIFKYWIHFRVSFIKNILFHCVILKKISYLILSS